MKPINDVEQARRMQVIVERVLDQRPCAELAAYEALGGLVALQSARTVDPVAVVDSIAEAGLRGRGGAGFPTATKWRTVAEHSSLQEPTPVVINGAEGEPGSFKDRTLLRANPYKVLEGALIAAAVIGADEVTVALKGSFDEEFDRTTAAIAELENAGWLDGVSVQVARGPSHYLLGEETALLEAIDGRPPFPRVSPPYRRGSDAEGSSAEAELATEDPSDGPAPALVNNVETFANIAGIVNNGPAWFREHGTEESPGTVLCTITGDTARHAVAEVPMGTTLSEAIEEVGGGMADEASAMAAISGVANPLVPARHFDTPLSHEAMAAIGSGLGTAGFIVFDDRTDPLAVARGVADFLAVESCGQCEPCKLDGLAVRELLSETAAPDERIPSVENHLATITDGARCALASQQQSVIRSALALLPEEELDSTPQAPADPFPILPMEDIVDGRAVLDHAQATKNPDWTYGGAGSGDWPATAGVPDPSASA